MIGYVCETMNRVMRLINNPQILCSAIEKLPLAELLTYTEKSIKVLNSSDRSLIKHYKIKRNKYYKNHNGKRYEYEYIEVYDKKGSRYVKPRPVLRVNVNSEEAKKVEDVVRAATLLDKLAGVLREARFIAEELIDFLSKYCGDS